MREALIVAGGRSTRFGQADKAVARLAGVPMIRRVADRLATTVDGVTINCRDDQCKAIRSAMTQYPLRVDYRIDQEPDQGPLAGIGWGMRGIEAELTFVAACDMPFVEPAVVELLFERTTGVDAAIPKPGEWFEPLHAAYRTEAMEHACQRAMAAGDERIVHAIDRIDHRAIGADEIARVGSLNTLENVNTKAAFEAAETTIATEEGTDGSI